MKSKMLTAHHQARLEEAYAHYQSGRMEEAVALFSELHELYPEDAQILTGLGTIALQLGMLEEGVRFLEKSLEINPDQPSVFSNRGIGLASLGRLNEAVYCYDQAILLKPDYANAYNNRGIALRAMGRYDEALSSYDSAVNCKPDYPEAYYNLGNILQDIGRKEEAEASYSQAIMHAPGYVQAYDNRGNVLKALGRLEEALADYDHAISLAPGYAQVYGNRGNVLKDLGRLDEALGSYDRAITIDPLNEEVHNNKGMVLQDMGLLKEALACYEHAAKIKPEYAPAYWSMALLKLLAGDYDEGWKLYEWRWKDSQKDKVRVFSQPLWLGVEALKGKALLIYAEQGLGDSIQFCRYALMAASQGARVVLEVPAPLSGLMATLGTGINVVEKGGALPDFDYQCPIMSLPLAFKTTLSSVPATVPYLHADPSKRQQWQQRLGAKGRFRVGLVWSGRPEHKNDHNRSIPLKLLEPLLQLPMEFHALQKEIRSEDAHLLTSFDQVRWHGADLQDFTDTAALMDEMDVVISVDTSVAHLAGAMGKPVWILLPYAPDFRWLLQRGDRPWYPTARLFRQPAMNDWISVIEGVKTALCSVMQAQAISSIEGE
jgi:hypothetical protein